MSLCTLVHTAYSSDQIQHIIAYHATGSNACQQVMSQGFTPIERVRNGMSSAKVKACTTSKHQSFNPTQRCLPDPDYKWYSGVHHATESRLPSCLRTGYCTCTPKERVLKSCLLPSYDISKYDIMNDTKKYLTLARRKNATEASMQTAPTNPAGLQGPTARINSA